MAYFYSTIIVAGLVNIQKREFIFYIYIMYYYALVISNKFRRKECIGKLSQLIRYDRKG